jgi:hypothetical protein
MIGDGNYIEIVKIIKIPKWESQFHFIFAKL